MSAYRADILDEDGVPYEAIVDEHPNHLIVAIPAQLVRDIGLGLVSAEEEGRVGRAHIHITGKKTRGRQGRLADAATWVKGPG